MQDLEMTRETPPQRRSNATGGALALALCATFSSGAAQAVPVIVDIPDVLLGSYALDFNGDSVAEYTFGRTDTGPSYLNSVNTFGNWVVGYTVGASDPKPGTYASALAGGETIDGSRAFVSGADVILSGKGVLPYGEFNDGLAYLGLRFLLDGATHYGWVEIIGQGNGDVTLTRYGWDNEARVAVVTPPAQVPEPGTLALLIAGAAGVLAMRRRQREA